MKPLVMAAFITALSASPEPGPLTQEFSFKISKDSAPAPSGSIVRIIDPELEKIVFTQKITTPGLAGPVILSAGTEEVGFSVYLDSQKLRTRGGLPRFVPGGEPVILHAYDGLLDHRPPVLEDYCLKGSTIRLTFSETLDLAGADRTFFNCTEQIRTARRTKEGNGLEIELDGINRDYVQLWFRHPIKDLFGNELILDPLVIYPTL